VIRVTWTDGYVIEVEDWSELVDLVHKMPWNAHIKDMRNTLAHRAYVWSGRIVNPTLVDSAFWRELESAGLVTIELT
jgi:hypothetical protein